MPTLMDVFAGFASGDEFVDSLRHRHMQEPETATTRLSATRSSWLAIWISGWMFDASIYTRINHDDRVTKF
jgi:hypothetical protein